MGEKFWPTSSRFGFKPEITAKVERQHVNSWRVCEILITYSVRTYPKGRKIGLKDVFYALYCIV
jgi:hypothetical protein